MDFFKRLAFMTLSKKDVIANNFLDEQTDRVLSEFDQEYRFKDVNELTYPDREIKTNLLYAATTFWTVVVNASHSIYKKIQILEADYSDIKSQLDNKIEYELENYEKKRTELHNEIEYVNKEIQEYHIQSKSIESEYHKVADAKKVKGSLSRLSGFWFLLIMGIAGIAELFMYKNVFLSQEIGLMADRQEQDKQMLEFMALGMASGFTVMIIWLAHKMGEMLRHLDSAIESEKKASYYKLGFIALVVSAAIFATVTLRGDMHTILAKDIQVNQIQNSMEDDKSLFNNQESDTSEDDSEEGFGSGEEESESGDGFGESGGFGDTSEDAQIDEEEATKTKPLTKEEKIEKLRNEVNEDKNATAWLFSVINIFIVVGGIFLSYETHTSSRVYETIEKHLAKLEKLKKSLEKELKKLDNEIMSFKSSKINKLFKELLLKAALYDKEVRTYNTYMHIFELKMQLVQDYIKKVYEEKKVAYTPIEYLEVLQDRVTLDYRRELHHVNNIEEYMIYNYSKSEQYKDILNIQKGSKDA